MARPRALEPLEAQAQETIVAVAQLRGWERIYHTHNSRNSAGGFPDLVLVKRRIVFAELKQQGKKPRPDQVGWLDDIAAAGGEAYLWTIDDLAEIQRILGGLWQFVPHGQVAHPFSAAEGPRLVTAGSGGLDFTPRSSWIPGHGRRDA